MYVILGLLVVGGIWFLYNKFKKNTNKKVSNNIEQTAKLKQDEEDSFFNDVEQKQGAEKTPNDEEREAIIRHWMLQDNIYYISEELYPGFHGTTTPKDFARDIRWFCKEKLYSVERFEVSETHPFLSAVDGILYNKEKTLLLCCPPKYNANVCIPLSVVEIVYNAFADCSLLKSMRIPDTVKTIEGRAFYNCSSLQSIDLPIGVETIGQSAFEGCTSLQSIQIPDTVTTIEDRAFYNCKLLHSIEIPDSVLSFGSAVLENCHSLLHITAGVGMNFFYPGGCFRLKQILDKTWGGVEKDKDLHVYTPKKGKSILSCDNEGFIISTPRAKYNVLVDYMGEETELKIPEGISVIDSYAFYQREIKSVVIPKSVRFISKKAFYQCETLEKVVFEGDGELEIMSQAFALCYNLQDVFLGQAVSKIGDEAFKCCRKLKVLNIPKSVSFIGGQIVSDCAGMEKIVFEDTKGWTTCFGDGLNLEYPQVNAKKLQESSASLKKKRG